MTTDLGARVSAKRADPMHAFPIGFRLAAAIAGGLGTAAVFGGRLYAGSQRFTDLIAGEIAMGAYHKSGDYRLIALFLIATGVIYVGLGSFRALRPSKESRPAGAAERLLLLVLPLVGAALILLRWVASELRHPGIGLLLYLLCGLVVVGAVGYRILGPDRRDRRECVERTVLALIVASFCFVTVLGLLLTLSSVGLLPRMPRNFVLFHAADLAYAYLIGGTFFTVAATVGRFDRPTLFRWSLQSQLLVPLVIIWPVVGVHERDGSVFRANVSGFAFVLTFVVIAIGIIASWRRAQRLQTESSALRAILPWTVIAVAVLSVSADLPSSAFVLGDQFHTGELAIQWPQLTSFDHVAFSSFIPIPGLLGGFIGLVNDVLFAGMATSWPLAVGFTDALVAALSAAVLIRLVGATRALLLSTTLLLSSVLVPTNRTQFLFLPIAVLALPWLLERPLVWLATWIAIGAFGTAFVSSNGLALTLGTAPIFIWVAAGWLRTIRKDGPSLGRDVPGLAAVTLIGLVLLAFLPNLIGLAEYLRQGTKSNPTAYGIGLFQFSSVPGLPDSLPLFLRRSVWELIRSGAWIAGLPALAALVHVMSKRGALVSPLRGPSSPTTFALSVLGFYLASIPYVFGRIDPPSALSRHGILSASFFALFLPTAFMLARAHLRTTIAVVMSLAWGLMIWGVFFPLRPPDLVRRAVLPITQDQSSREVGTSPRLSGGNFVEAEDLQALKTLGRVLRGTLRPGETYYDATNRSLFYLALEARVPTIFSGPFYAADEWAQRRVIGSLAEDPPPVVWVGPNFFRAPDFPAFGLRAYRIHKWLLLRGYNFFRVEELEFLVSPDRTSGLPPYAERLDDPASWWSLNPRYIASIPISWGRSFDSLSFRFGPGLHLDQEPGTSLTSAEWRVPPELPGRRYDFLLVDLSCSTGSKRWMPAHLEWDVHAGSRRIRMRAADGRLLVPLGADPAWLLGDTAGVIRLTITLDPTCGRIRFGQAKLIPLER